MSLFKKIFSQNAAGTIINPATDEHVANIPDRINNEGLWLIRRIVKMLEPLATQDSNQRQRVVVDAGTITTVSTVSTIAAGTITTVTTCNTVASVTNVAGMGGYDPKWFIMETARASYSQGIRTKLNWS